MKDDEFWIEPIKADGHTAIVRACFNEFSVTILVERKDGSPISDVEAERAYNGVIRNVPLQVRFRFDRDRK